VKGGAAIQRMLLLGFVLCAFAIEARAQAEPAESTTDLKDAAVLRWWAQEPTSQRNRVNAAALSEAVSRELLVALQGVRGCECFARRLRWVWALPRPQDKLHPAIVVAFDDPLRDPSVIVTYRRFALLRFDAGRYVVAGVLSLNRPSLASDGGLDVRILPRRDFDTDGQLDIAIAFEERIAEQVSCGVLRFLSGSGRADFEPNDCSPERDPALVVSSSAAAP
jgi:hypothetical protein